MVKTTARPRRWVQTLDEVWVLEDMGHNGKRWRPIAYVWRWSTTANHPWRSQIASKGPETNEDHETLEDAMIGAERLQRVRQV